MSTAKQSGSAVAAGRRAVIAPPGRASIVPARNTMGGMGSGPRGPPIPGEQRGVRVYETTHEGDPHADPSRRVPAIFKGAKDTASASQDKKPPPKMHAAKRSSKDIRADEDRARDEERKKRRLSRDAAKGKEGRSEGLCACRGK